MDATGSGQRNSRVALRLPGNVDPQSVRIVDGVLVFDITDLDDQDIVVIRGNCEDSGCGLEHVLTVESVNRRTILDGTEKHLTARPFDVLCYFAHSPQAYISADTLYRDVWGWTVKLNTRAVDYAIHRARKVLPTGWLKHKASLGWRLIP